MEICLSRETWEVKGYYPYVPIKETSMELGQELKGITDWIPASVPGGVHYDLWKNGDISHPYEGMNSLSCEWIENRWWMYRTTFQKPEYEEGKRVFLLFEGLDYEASIFLNDTPIGDWKGMYEPCKIEVTKLIKKENRLVVLFKGVPQEMGQIGYTSKTSTQKSRFNYKWDFSTHLVNIGIWQDVKLIVEEDITLEEPYLYTDWAENSGYLFLEGLLLSSRKEEVTLRWYEYVGGKEGKQLGEENCEVKEGKTRFYKRIQIPNPKLWYPNGAGEQPLYGICLAQKGRVIFEGITGIRNFELMENEASHPGALPYTFVVNGEKIYIKGFNVTPLDHLYGNVSKQQYEQLVRSVKEANGNLIRVWGGGLIEKEWLYEICDREGILIWQEFIQSSSGIDNKPCEDPEFLELLKRNSTAAIKGRRNHVSLCVWSGGNELTERENRPCGYDNKNIAMLKELVEAFDFTRPFLPTSASGPREFVSLEKGVSHDVHGGWRYEGNPEHYEKYGESDHLFHSEFGTDGTPSLKTMRKFLEEKDLYPTPMSENLIWQHHGEWWGTYYRDVDMFGEIKDIGEFTRISQMMQTEGLRFILEADRRKKFHSSGSIIWQMNEPWPNASCTNLLDYYGELKPAWSWVQKAYAPIHVSMDYRRLDVEPESKRSLPIYLHNSLGEQEFVVEAGVYDVRGKLYEKTSFQVKAEKNTTSFCGNLEGDWEGIGIYLIRLEVFSGSESSTSSLEKGSRTECCKAVNNKAADNTYWFGEKSKHPLEKLRGLEYHLELQCVERKELSDGAYQEKLLLTNTGSMVAIQAGIELKKDDYWMLTQENYQVLLPGEKREITTRLYPKKCGGFLEVYNHADKQEAALETSVEKYQLQAL